MLCANSGRTPSECRKYETGECLVNTTCSVAVVVDHNK